MRAAALAALLFLAGCAGLNSEDPLAGVREVTTEDLKALLSQVHEQRREGRDARWGYCQAWAAAKAEAGAYAEAMDILERCEPPLVTEQLLERLRGAGLSLGMLL
jgi:hypothetical protein